MAEVTALSRCQRTSAQGELPCGHTPCWPWPCSDCRERMRGLARLAGSPQAARSNEPWQMSESARGCSASCGGRFHDWNRSGAGRQLTHDQTRLAAVEPDGGAPLRDESRESDPEESETTSGGRGGGCQRVSTRPRHWPWWSLLRLGHMRDVDRSGRCPTDGPGA